MIYTLHIEGISCASCVASITNATKHLTKHIHINIITKIATIESSANIDEIMQVISHLGYKPRRIDSASFNPSASFPAVSSPTSAILAPNSAISTPFIKPPVASFSSSSSLSFSPSKKAPSTTTHFTSSRTLHSSTSSSHMYPPIMRKAITHIEAHLEKRRIMYSALCALAVLYLSMAPMIFASALIAPWTDMRVNFCFQMLLTLCSMHLARRHYFIGFRTLFATATMDSLIAISTSAAFVYSVYNALHGLTQWYFESICVIVFFLLFGKGLEQNINDKTSSIIHALLLKNLTKVLRISQNKATEVPIQHIAIGDTLRIMPGQIIPTDGILLDRLCEVDESMLSGEILPISKQAGDMLYAGSYNKSHAFCMRASTTSEQSTLGRLRGLVKQAMVSKPSLARLTDSIASVFVYGVLCLGVVMFGLWWWLEGLDVGFIVCVSVLVISCPCALGLATPMAVMIGTSLANKAGIFIKQAQSFENLCKVSDVVFDKTGTLTQEELRIIMIKSLSDMSEDEILSLSAGLEIGSEHSIAKAICKEASIRKLDITACSDFIAHAGLGVEATYQGQVYMLGSSHMLEHLGISLKDDEKRSYMEVFLVKKQEKRHEILGVITLLDTLKPHTLDVIRTLKNLGLHLHILSGDTRANTSRISAELGIAHYQAELLPDDKLAYISALQAKGKVVLMVGDGVNDVGALARADVSISFAHASDVSKNAADIIIYHNDIRKIAMAFSLSRRIVLNMKENLIFAFVYNICCIPLACGALYYVSHILLNPMIAACAMSASSISVVLNSQRLWRYQHHM